MKSLISLFAVWASLTACAESAYKLSDAMQQKLVSVKFTGAAIDTGLHVPYSSHYGPCIALEITNNSAVALSLNLDYGYKIEPADTSVQTMVVTQTLVVSLPSKQKKNYRVYAMCTEAHDGAPSVAENFYMGKRTTGNLLALTELLNRKKYQSDAAQSAVWCLTNNNEVSSIFSEDTTMMYELRRFIVKAKNLSPKLVYENTGIGYTAPPVVQTRVVYSGSVNYSFGASSKILIALFDENNHMKKVYVNETQRPGDYTYNYEIGSDEMDNKKYYLRLFKDGKLLEEMPLTPQE